MNFRNFIFVLKMIPLTVGLGLAVVACQKGGGGSSPGPVAVASPSCVTCGTSLGAAMLVGVRSTTPDGLISFTLDVQAQPMQPCYQPANKAVICAKGPAALSGMMHISQDGIYCGSPAGDYTVNPLQVSTINLGVVSGGQYQAVGPGGFQFIFRLDKGILYNYSGTNLDISSPENHIGMSLYVESANGVNCGIMSTK